MFQDYVVTILVPMVGCYDKLQMMLLMTDHSFVALASYSLQLTRITTCKY